MVSQIISQELRVSYVLMGLLSLRERHIVVLVAMPDESGNFDFFKGRAVLKIVNVSLKCLVAMGIHDILLKHLDEITINRKFDRVVYDLISYAFRFFRSIA